VPLDEPSWWYAEGDDWRGAALAPAAALYARAVERRFARTVPRRLPVPVVCVGNFTAGGTGKTPLSLLLAETARARGRTPAFLTRGYGGRLEGPLVVEPGVHRAADVGDEPLLLARSAPTVVALDRASGASLLNALPSPPTLVLMDDGLQNPSLATDAAIAVIDGTRGLGNGRVIPAGPLRARLSFQLGLVDAVVVNAPDGREPLPGLMDTLRRQLEVPVLEARTGPGDDTSWLAGTGVVAFAGIGNPGRFFGLLRSLGAEPAAEVAFKDHHRWTERDARGLLALARDRQALLVTTEKDLVRLDSQDGALAELASTARALPVRMRLDARDQGRIEALIDGLPMVSPGPAAARGADLA